ncbi:MAG: hypothetical protein ABI378_09635 [Chitinophagaceae bacterium]
MGLTFLQHLHSILRWIVLLFGLLTLISSLRGLNGKRDFTLGDKRTALYLLISVDLQLLVGLSLYFSLGYFKAFTDGTMGAAMKDSVARFWTIEHSLGMILGIVLIHIGYAGIKGNKNSSKKFRRLFWCTLIAMIIFCAMIPWPFRMMGIAKPWF